MMQYRDFQVQQGNLQETRTKGARDTWQRLIGCLPTAMIHTPLYVASAGSQMPKIPLHIAPATPACAADCAADPAAGARVEFRAGGRSSASGYHKLIATLAFGCKLDLSCAAKLELERRNHWKTNKHVSVNKLSSDKKRVPSLPVTF